MYKKIRGTQKNLGLFFFAKIASPIMKGDGVMYTLESLIRNVQNDISDLDYQIGEYEKQLDHIYMMIDTSKKSREYSENLLNKLKALQTND